MFGGDVSLTGSTELGSRSTFAFRQAFAYVPSLVLRSDAYGGDILDPALTPEVASGVLDEPSRSSTSEVRIGAQLDNTTDHICQRKLRASDLPGRHRAQHGYHRRERPAHLEPDAGRRSDRLVSVFGYAPWRRQDSDDTGEVPCSSIRSKADDVQSQALSNAKHKDLWKYRCDASRHHRHADPRSARGLDAVGAALGRDGSGRTWTLNGNYSRSISVLQGLSLESFATNREPSWQPGHSAVGSRRSWVSTCRSGRTGGVENNPGTFAVYGGMAQFRYAFARCCAASLNYDYYYYKLDSVS